MVARPVAAGAAGGVHDYQSAGLSGGRIKPDGALLSFEGSMNIVEGAVQRKLDPGLRGIQFQY